MTIAVKIDDAVYKLNENNEFVCDHHNYELKKDEFADTNYYCPNCEKWAIAIPCGQDEWGHVEYADPKENEFN